MRRSASRARWWSSADDPEGCPLGGRLPGRGHQPVAAGAQLVLAQPPGEAEAVAAALGLEAERAADALEPSPALALHREAHDGGAAEPDRDLCAYGTPL